MRKSLVMQPKVSVIIPCYNVEKYLDRCLNTIIGQTLAEIEIILVDDKSPDGTPVTSDEWAKKDSRIKVIHKTRNEGLGYARNTGLEYATGEYVAFVDSDDFVDIRIYETLYKKAKEKNADVVYCNYNYYKNDNCFTPRIDVREETLFEGREKVDTFLLEMVGPFPECPRSVKYAESVWHAIYSKEVLNRNAIRFVSERDLVSEDLVFDIDYLQHCNRVVWIPDAMSFYCYNGESLSHTINDDKYYRLQTFIKSIDKRLASIFANDKYYIHLQRYVIFRFMTSCANAANERYSKITLKDVLTDEFWQTYIKGYPLNRLSLKYQFALMCTRHKVLWPILKIYL